MANMTYAQALDNAIALFSQGGQVDAEDKETVEKLTTLKESLTKRSSSKTPTKAQKENAVICEKIVESLRQIGEPCTVTALLKHGIEGFELSNQKASALLRNLIKEQKVVKTMDKKTALFALAE